MDTTPIVAFSHQLPDVIVAIQPISNHIRQTIPNLRVHDSSQTNLG